jgi:hypothetical protein
MYGDGRQPLSIQIYAKEGLALEVLTPIIVLLAQSWLL